MKKYVVWLAFTLILLLSNLIGVVYPVHAAFVLVGTNNPYIDPPALQSAINQGGEILLSGTFDLGSSSIYLKNGVTLSGERSGNKYLNVIRGGSYAINVYHNHDVTIQNLQLINPQSQGIRVDYGENIIIADNRIENPVQNPNYGAASMVLVDCNNCIVTRNTIIQSQPVTWYDAIVISSLNDSAITNNDIIIDPPGYHEWDVGGIDIWYSSRNDISHNNFQGRGSFAMMLLVCTDFLIQANNLNGYTIAPPYSYGADYFIFSSQNITGVGNFGTAIIETSTDINLTGLQSMQGGIGSDVSERIARMHDLLNSRGQ